MHSCCSQEEFKKKTKKHQQKNKNLWFHSMSLLGVSRGDDVPEKRIDVDAVCSGLQLLLNLSIPARANKSRWDKIVWEMSRWRVFVPF